MDSNTAECENKLTLVQNGDETGFHYQVTDLLAMTRQHARRQVDNTIVVTYYEVVKSTVSEHLSTIFKSAELDAWIPEYHNYAGGLIPRFR